MFCCNVYRWRRRLNKGRKDAAQLYPSQVTETVPFHRYYNGGNGINFYASNLLELGWGRGDHTYEGVATYLLALKAVPFLSFATTILETVTMSTRPRVRAV
jgi:hypothetical protein